MSKLPKRLWYCIATDAGYPIQCVQIGRPSQCIGCRGEATYCLEVNTKKARKKK